jgi:hypothetical protein
MEMIRDRAPQIDAVDLLENVLDFVRQMFRVDGTQLEVHGLHPPMAEANIG